MKNLKLKFFVMIFIVLPVCITSLSYLKKTIHRKIRVWKTLPKPAFKLKYPGNMAVIDYTKYGYFKNPGTSKYKYRMKKRRALINATGEGIKPSGYLVYRNPVLKKFSRLKRGTGTHWNYTKTPYHAKNFYIWATAVEEPGVKLFYTAEALKNAGHIIHALKAYHALTVFYPGSACLASNGSYVWYVGPVAIDRIRYLCRKYPELGLEFVDAWIDIKNNTDTNLGNDIVTVTPGRFIKRSSKPSKKDISNLKVIAQRGNGKVILKKYENGHWRMFVNGKPFLIKGVTYSPSKIGESPHRKTLRNWQLTDDNKNGIIDMDEVWIDYNRNNKKDKNEKTTSDFKILKDMGCNAIRYYHVPPDNKYNSKKQFNKKLLRKMYNKYGIRIIMGDFFGAYTIGSRADWNKGTDYTDKKQLARMKKIIRKLVLDHRKEPYVLMWLLGNENNMPGNYKGVNATRTRAGSQPKAYAKFLNECAKMIHKLDPDHPVAVGNLETFMIEYYAKYAPEIDILGINAYRGMEGFGSSLWEGVRRKFDRPVLITEFGCDVWDSNMKKEDETKQSQYHKGNWDDILANLFGTSGEGNALGGVVFEYIDEWWKSIKGKSNIHDNTKDCTMPFFDGHSSEEYLGITSQGKGKHSPWLRQLRKVYYYYKKTWK
ncbi:MAG: hypothetical protein KAS64_01260 [Spirochaetes bacterium]|nr:hypothetical protein [Spirochaetota bacterium]